MPPSSFDRGAVSRLHISGAVPALARLDLYAFCVLSHCYCSCHLSSATFRASCRPRLTPPFLGRPPHFCTLLLVARTLSSPHCLLFVLLILHDAVRFQFADYIFPAFDQVRGKREELSGLINRAIRRSSGGVRSPLACMFVTPCVSRQTLVWGMGRAFFMSRPRCSWTTCGCFR